jgi:hypothetical protein
MRISIRGPLQPCVNRRHFALRDGEVNSRNELCRALSRDYTVCSGLPQHETALDPSNYLIHIAPELEVFGPARDACLPLCDREAFECVRTNEESLLESESYDLGGHCD